MVEQQRDKSLHSGQRWKEKERRDPPGKDSISIMSQHPPKTHMSAEGIVYNFRGRHSVKEHFFH